MDVSGNTVLITGGTAGIGFVLAKRFIDKGNTVIVCGRRKEKLDEAKEQLPSLVTRMCDVTKEADRQSLFTWVTAHYPDVNVLVNNAGILRRFDMFQADVVDEWAYYGKEINANMEGPIHLGMMFAQYIAPETKGAIVNISSGLAFTPDPMASIYSATKAAIHSFSISLRHQLADTPIDVVEIAPPLVNTSGLHTEAVPVNEFVDGVFKSLEEGKREIGYGGTEKSFRMSRDDVDEAVNQIFGKKNNQSFGD